MFCPFCVLVTNRWKQEQLYVSVPKYALVFTADRGPDKSGTIVVDDVTVSSGPCSGEVLPTPGEGECE